MAWVDMEIYAEIPNASYRRHQAKRIFNFYVKKGAKTAIPKIKDAARTKVRARACVYVV